MSMKDYPVNEFGLALKRDEFLDLIKTYNGKNEEIKELIEEEEAETLATDIFNIFYVEYNFVGEFEPLNYMQGGQMKYFDDEIVIVILLDKVGLFIKYENKNEIYQEIADKLKEIGVKADMDFIKNNTGELTGTCYG